LKWMDDSLASTVLLKGYNKRVSEELRNNLYNCSGDNPLTFTTSFSSSTP
jgi:hypothetical protein